MENIRSTAPTHAPIKRLPSPSGAADGFGVALGGIHPSSAVKNFAHQKTGSAD
jgi:hypothetical protein